MDGSIEPFDGDAGQTPLDPDESDGLRLSWVRTRDDLNLAESDNILAARRRVGRPTVSEVLDDVWLRGLHRAMFGEVWSWAGSYRSTLKSIGIDPTLVAVAVRDLVQNARVWIDAQPVLREGGPQEERLPAALQIVARFHHQLVWIHPFANGNGRHARAATDCLLGALGFGVELTWGRNLGDVAVARAQYLTALRRADEDREDLDELVAFLRS
ncbi:MAG: hypothetical protein JWL72_4139 [Ilumatobacteraceae bacterium]|nr:hypothetical protein [Ilumatobacteraceae bacterium]